MKKLLGLLLALGMLCAIGGTASAACRGWGGWTLNVFDRAVFGNAPHADAILSKCTCTPVDNYLSAGIRVQFKIGENGTTYYWNPGQYSYKTTSNSNTNSVCASIELDSPCIITYAKASFSARCGSDPMSSFTREWTGNPTEKVGDCLK